MESTYQQQQHRRQQQQQQQQQQLQQQQQQQQQQYYGFSFVSSYIRQKVAFHILTGKNSATESFSSDWKSESLNLNFSHYRFQGPGLIKSPFKKFQKMKKFHSLFISENASFK